MILGMCYLFLNSPSSSFGPALVVYYSYVPYAPPARKETRKETLVEVSDADAWAMGTLILICHFICLGGTLLRRACLPRLSGSGGTGVLLSVALPSTGSGVLYVIALATRRFALYAIAQSVPPAITQRSQGITRVPPPSHLLAVLLLIWKRFIILSGGGCTGSVHFSNVHGV